MAIPVARVHLKVAHAALPALLPTPAKWKMLPLLPTPCVAAVFPKLPTKPSRADADERWDLRKTKPACTESSASANHRPIDSVTSNAGRGSAPGLCEPRKNATSPPKPGRADSVERWDAPKKAASLASSSSSSSSSSGKWTISRASSAERWDVHKKRRSPQADLQFDNGENSSTGSNDIDTEEEILWKPRAMYAGPGFVGAAPESSMLPMPTAFLVGVA